MTTADFVFWLSFLSTVLHILVQWTEALVTLFAIRFDLRPVSNFREISLSLVSKTGWIVAKSQISSVFKSRTIKLESLTCPERMATVIKLSVVSAALTLNRPL